MKTHLHFDQKTIGNVIAIVVGLWFIIVIATGCNNQSPNFDEPKADVDDTRLEAICQSK